MALVHQDDWLINVLLWDKRVYTFNTELWPEHGSDVNWPRAFERAERTALSLAWEDAQTWSVPTITVDMLVLREMLDELCRATSDEDFRRFIR